jgi:hypothetical protein
MSHIIKKPAYLGRSLCYWPGCANLNQLKLRFFFGCIFNNLLYNLQLHTIEKKAISAGEKAITGHHYKDKI